MATFYLLPSRPLVGQRMAEFLTTVFPGLPWARGDWCELAETLGLTAMTQPDVYVVYREDLADGVPVEETLGLDFGAEPGDEVVEVMLGGRLSPLAVKRWRFGDEGRAAA